MLRSTIELENKHSVTKAVIILGLVIIAAYSPIIFLDQSYNRSTPIPKEFLDYDGKSIVFITVTDPSAAQVIWPNIKLATELFLEGNIPLWNPYIGVGQPLAAESQEPIFSPLILGFLLPVALWDVPLLIALWVTGIFTFLFLRSLGLNFISSVSGGIFYMLSGAMSWYLPNTNHMVNTFTPFILYSLEKIIQKRDLQYIPLASIAFSLGILGAHLESIILQFTLAGCYLFYRILHPILSNYRKDQIYKTDNSSLCEHSPKRILTWSALAFLGGLGLSAFFILSVYEFVGNSYVEHDISWGIKYGNPVGLSQVFLPYILGPLQYWSQSITFTPNWGYVGVLALFFSIVGVWLSLKKRDSIHRYTPLFFISLAVFFIMKTVGVPAVNWIGYLPIFNLLSFSHWSGAIIPIGFAVAAAFGIDLLGKCNITRRNLVSIFVISVSTMFLLLIPLIPYLSPDAKFPIYITANDARNYVTFQIIQSALFALMALLTSIATIKNKSAILGVASIIILELSLYIPVGLHPIWLAYKSIIVLVGMSIITFLVLKPNRYTWNFESKNLKWYVVIGILITTFVGVVSVSEFSPFGMMKRYESFQENPVTDFLKQNLGNSRMFSFGYALGSNYPSGYQISTIGQQSPISLNSFHSFIHNFLDKQAYSSWMGFPPWTYSYGPMGSINKFTENKKYFDFLGVKYILTQGYNFNTIAYGIPGSSGEFTQIRSHDNSTGQSFISPTNSISTIGVSLGTYQLQDQGNIILILDSVPRDEKYHRESILNQTINQQYNEFSITPPLIDVSNKEFYMSLKYQQADVSKLAVVFTISGNQTGYDIIKNELQGKFYENGIPVEGKQMAFSITSDSNKHPVAFKFHDIYLYENTDAFPRAFLVNKFHVVDEGKAQDFLIKNPDFDLRHEVILEEQLPEQESNLLKSSILQSSAEIVSFSANKVTIKTDSTGASLLVLTDAYYPGWKAYVDGKETEIYRADGLVRAIFVPVGIHDIEFSYLPESFVIGVVISLSTVAILFGLFVYSRREKKLVTG